MLKELKERAHERRLGSDARAGRRVRDQRRRTQWDYVRRHWNLLGTGVALGGLATALVTYIAPNTFLRGAVVGAGVVVVLGGIAFTVFVFTGSGSQTMGAIAETWTSSELRPLRKHGWRLIDHVFYRYADADHLLVGPGGAIVVETKWSARACVTVLAAVLGVLGGLYAMRLAGGGGRGATCTPQSRARPA